jgi:CMP-N,N'-diacetyllegionaminic acid synthase
MNVLGLVVARGGSKGVPRKNLKKLCGQPLIRYTIETAKQSSLLSSIVISTDDNEIAEVAAQYGCEVPFMRPANLASDKATIIPVIKHALDELEAVGRHFDAVFLLQPTNPLRTVTDINNTINMLQNSDADSILSVVKVEDHHPARMKLIGSDGFLKEPPYAAKIFDAPRQSFEDVYLRNGAVYLFRTSLIKEHNKIMGETCLPYIIPRERGFNIDDEVDFVLIESLLNVNLPQLEDVIRYDR